MAQANGARTRRRPGASNAKSSKKPRYTDNAGLIPVLARAVREVEKAADRGKLTPANRTKYLVVAVLMREERQHAKASKELGDADRVETMRRLDGIATILAQTAAKDTSLIALLESDAPLSPAAQKLRRDMLVEAGVELDPDDLIIATETAPVPVQERAVVPQSVVARTLANPFLAPDFSKVQPKKSVQSARLANWELLSPLFKAFEYGSSGQAASMELPAPDTFAGLVPRGLELMPYQARFLGAVKAGHRSFLLADEPGLGKTAQSLLAASVAGAYPLLAVVPNVVKMNWAREVERWTPNRSVTVIQGDGENLDAFADVVVVNYDVLDRHMGWLGRLGFRGMVVDEAHFIKNLTSQRSKNVLALADSIRRFSPGGEPLMMALTGTPLINSIEDFKAIWQYLGWLDGDKPAPALMAKLEETGMTPVDFGFFAAARQAVIDMGIVRRRKIDVAADLPSRRVADLPVELDDAMGRSIRQAESELADRLVGRYRRLAASKQAAEFARSDLVRMVAQGELDESKASQSSGQNVFTLVRQLGQAKAVLAADYAAQLAASVGKVVFFAKHIDVMNAAEQLLRGRGLKTASIRGDQTATQRQAEIDAFTNDPDVAVIVCSLTAAGVGVNLQVASNVVLAELSWTSAEQTQAIDRVHRIGQDEPVTAWRILASHTIDVRIAELIDAKAGLAARALDGEDVDAVAEGSVQRQALETLLLEALEAEGEAAA